MKLKRSAALAAGIIMAAALLAGCSGSPSATPSTTASADDPLAKLADAACKEGALTVYASAADATITGMLDAFKKDYPCIQTDYFRAAGTALFNRFQSEAEAGSVAADVFLPTVQPSFIADHKDWFVKLTDEVLPAAKGWPKDFRDDYTIQTAVEEIVAIYNTNTVKSPPKKWEDVLSSKYDGRIILVDPKASPSYMSWYEIARKKFGDDFLRKLGELHPVWVDTGAVGAQQVATGAKDIVIPTYPSHATALLAQNAPIGLVRDMDPTMGITTSTAITKDAPHPNAARLFANWMLTKQGFDSVCKNDVFAAVTDGTSCRTLSSHFTPPVWDIPQTEQDQIVSLLGR